MRAIDHHGPQHVAPQHIVEVARGFGERGFVQSICEDDFVPAIDLIITRIAETLEPILE